MATVFVPNAVPKNVQWWGIGREATAGTIVAPSISVPLDNGMPNDQVNMLLDKSLRGDMAEDYNMILGTEIGALPLSGDVYLDSIGYILHNLMGEYTAVGSSPGTSGTVTAAITAGAAGPFAGTGLPTGAVGTPVQLGTSPNATEVCTLASGSTATSLVLQNPPRLSHAASCPVASVSAPFTHTFKVLNPGGATAFGAAANAQPVTHTITHYNGLATSNKARQYAYWCCSGANFAMDTNNLFQHNSSGTSFIGTDAASAVTNTQGSAPAQPNWLFKVGLGGPASGGTLINNVEQAAISPVRELTSKFALAGQQSPVIIGRLGVSVSGRLTFLAQDESPLLTTLAGTQQQLQLAMTNGLSGAQQLGVTFNFQLAQFEQAQLSDPDMMQYDVSFRGLNNTTDAGLSGGKAPMSITVVNAVPTF